MDTRFVFCKSIDVTPGSKGTSTFSRAFAANLAVSIKNEGLINPITVRVHPTNKDRFQLIAGRHRLYAVKTINGEEVIACHVVDMNDAEAEIASISENLWRHDASKTQKIKAIQIWHAHYASRHDADFAATPEGQAKAIEDMHVIDGLGVSVKKGSATVKMIEHASQAPALVSNAFAAAVGSITGESLRTTKRQVKIAKAFSPDDLEVFEAQGLTGQQIELIAMEKEAGKRRDFVTLIASGLGFEESYKSVNGVKPDLTASSKAVKEEVRVAETEAVPEMSDDDWFATHCGDKAALIQHQNKYRQAAILYRQIATARAKFRSSVKKILAEQKAAGQHQNPMWHATNKMISLSHPRDWYICNTCAGQCVNHGTEEECPSCFGAGFGLRAENYL